MRVPSPSNDILDNGRTGMTRRSLLGVMAAAMAPMAFARAASADLSSTLPPSPAVASQISPSPAADWIGGY